MIELEFWLGAAMLSALVGFVLLRVLMRGGQSGRGRTESDLAVYRHQLDEVARDLDRGVLTPDQAAAARTEIERRLLRASNDTESVRETPRRVPAWAGLTVAVGVPGAALVIYMLLGAPGRPDMPLAGRNQPTAEQIAERERFEQMTETLATRMRERPSDTTGWVMLGRAYRILGRYDESVAALREAVSTVGGESAAPPVLLTELGEVLAYSAGGTVPPEALRLFEQAAGRDPSQMKALYYIAAARAQTGDLKGSLAILRGIVEDGQPAAAEIPALRARIAQLETEIGPEAASVRPESPGAPDRAGSGSSGDGPFSGAIAGSGPDKESLAAVSEMSPEQRQTFIRDMVQRLAERMAREPGNPDGWVRLGRAYTVLGDEVEAAVAFERAAGIWRARLERLPADAPERPELQRKLEQVQNPG